MKVCIGIDSGLPGDIEARRLRGDRLNRLLKQLEEIGPTVPVLIVAQNGNGYKPQTKLNLKIHEFKRLGILKARQKLRELFLATDYDYLIMLDDDAIIEYTADAPAKYMKTLEDNPHGFAFIHGEGASPYTDYADSQLNLCAISRSIYQQVEMPNVDPQRSEAFEDRVFSTYLHYCYGDREFYLPNTIRCVHFKNPNEKAPSTWSQEKKYNWQQMRQNTKDIEKYIVENGVLPNLQQYHNR